MKKILQITIVGMFITSMVAAQDEGVISRRERIDRSNSFFIDFGPSFTLGKNIGDYSLGFSVETGFQKRLNRVLSIGPSISYLNFNYDPDVTSPAYVGSGDPNDWGTKYGLPNLDYFYGYYLTLEGGDLGLFSFAVNFKLNLVPIRDNSRISVYGFAKPFVSLASRKEVNGTDRRYTYETYEDRQGTANTSDDILHYNLGDGTYYPDNLYSEDGEGSWGPDSYEALKSGTEVTGGIFVGPGIEVMPAKAVSIFLQAAFGYTFPVTFVGTASYEPTLVSYLDENFPMTKEGFPSVNVQLGVSFNF